MALKAEEGGVAPCLYASSTDTDGYIALEHYAMLVSIVGSALELLVQVILNEKIDGTFGTIEIFIIRAVVAPLRIVGRTVLVAQVAVGCIGT